MYRTGDPRFRRRLNELGQTLENANESAQSGLYIFGHNYIKPCFDSITAGLTTCIDASCPSLNLAQSEQARRQRGRARSRGRAELNFDFYDDWDDDENEGLLGWGDDEFDRLVIGDQGYGTVTNTQPARQRGMSYPKGRRKSGVPGQEGSAEQSAIPGSTFFARLFGGKALQYRPSAANLQDHPGARRSDHDVPEGEALLGDPEAGKSGKAHRRIRSNTVGSGHTTDSLSSRGDIFPSDEEDDAVPLDDEFAMVLERRNTQSGPEDSASAKTRSPAGTRRRSKRPSTGSRTSTGRTRSSRSGRSSFGRNSLMSSRRSSEVVLADAAIMDEDEADNENGDDEVPVPPTLSELKQEEEMLEREEEAEIQRRRQEAQRLAADRGLVGEQSETNTSTNAEETNQPTASNKAESIPDSNLPSQSSPPTAQSSTSQPNSEPNQLPTPIATDDEADAPQTSPSDVD